MAKSNATTLLLSLFALLAISPAILPPVLASPSTVVTEKTNFRPQCTMCSSCDNPCQTTPSPPPPSSSGSANCPPPPPSPKVSYTWPPPPSTAIGGLVNPPPFSNYPAPPPPNPIIPYFPFYYHAPPPPSFASKSARLSLKMQTLFCSLIFFSLWVFLES